MNILFSCSVDLSKKESASTHVTEVVTNMLREGHGLKLIVAGSKKGFRHKNLEIFKLPRFSSLRKRYVDSVIRKTSGSFDVVYERHDMRDFAAVSAERKVPCVLEVNGAGPAEAEFTGVDKEYIEDYKKKEVDFFGLADKLVVVSEGIKNYYAGLGVKKEKMIVIQNGVNRELFKPIDQKKCKKELNIDGFPIILFVGSFRPWQGIEKLIESMPTILESFPNAMLVIVGSTGDYGGFKFGPTEEELIEISKNLRVDSSVRMPGAVPYEKVPVYINASDICISPVVEQRLCSSLKIFEYMACGKPVISTRIFDLRNFKHKRDIYFSKPNPKDLSKSVMAVSDHDLGQKMSSNALEISERFTWKRSASEVLSVLNKVLDSG